MPLNSRSDHYQPETLAEVLENIRDPQRWIELDAMVEVVKANPSLRGMIYGYVAEVELKKFLAEHYGVTQSYKPDDHLKNKSDLTFVHGNRQYTVQVKSLQTNSIRAVISGNFSAVLQNDASDKRTVKLPNGETLETTCYVIGEYDILAVGLHPFTRQWTFAFKKNKDLTKTSSRKYTQTQQQFLLHTTERLTWPLTEHWSTDLLSLLGDVDLGTPVGEAEQRLEVLPDETVVKVIDVPGVEGDVVVIEPPTS